jgi:hypothetical protein
MAVIFAVALGVCLCLLYQKYDKFQKAQLAAALKEKHDIELQKTSEVAVLTEQVSRLAAMVETMHAKKSE